MAAVVGSDGFSKTSAEREIEISVAQDADAYLSLKHGDGDGGDLVFSQGDDPFEPPVSLRVENRVTVPLDVKIDISPGDAVLRDVPGGSDTGSVEFEIDVGDDKKIKIDFDGFGSVDAELDITAEGRGQSGGESQVRIEALRTVSLERGINGVYFNGGGTVSVSGLESGNIEAELLYLPSNRDSESGSSDQNSIQDDAEVRSPKKNPNGNLKLPIRGDNPSGRIVAIYFPELDEVYVHPEIDGPSSDEPEISNSGSGDGVSVTEGEIYDKFT